MRLSASYIDSEESLQTLQPAISAAEWVALDTEFVRERTYHPRLCLVQMATPQFTTCVDVLAFDASAFFSELLERKDLVKVIHSARQDIEALLCTYQCLTAPVFDTQIAAGFLGEHEQLSYAELVRRELDIELDKDQTRTDWSRRPLSEKQLKYAADDVHYLAALYPQLTERLLARGRGSWVEEDCAALSIRDLYVTEPDQAWRRVKGTGRLDAAQHRLARELAAWRESQAVERNLPRGFVFKDKTLLEIATGMPTDKAGLAKCGLSTGMIRRHGDRLIALITETGTKAIDSSVHRPAPERLDARQQQLLSRLQECLKSCAKNLDIHPTVLATRAQLEAMVRQPEAESHRPFQGWRGPLVGDAMKAILRADAA